MSEVHIMFVVVWMVELVLFRHTRSHFMGSCWAIY